MSRALVVLSGGQDSCTCLYWAKTQFDEVHAVTFDYNQRHKIEIDAAKRVATMAKIDGHEIIELGPILQGTSPLVNPLAEVEHYGAIEDMPGGVEPTFVPGRNALFLTIAANRAFNLECTDLVTGVSQEDFGGYFDCREQFIKAQEQALSEALYGQARLFEIHTPLIHKSKADTVRMALELEGCMEAMAYTHTCYDGQYPPNPSNHASMLRAMGFLEAGVADPLILRAISEGLLPDGYPKDGYVEADIQIVGEDDPIFDDVEATDAE